MEPLLAGLVGCGSLSQRGILPHLAVEDAQAQIRLQAVVDTDEERAELTARRFTVPFHFTSLDEMLATTDLDLVLIITPIQTHYSHALAAIEAGKHVYVQKTMTTTVAEADALLAARDRMGVKLAVAPGFELFPSTAEIRRIVADGQLGRVNIALTYTLGFGHEWEPIRSGQSALEAIDPSWYYREGAGPLPDVTVYSLQLATSVLGPVQRVTGLANVTAEERVWQDRAIRVDVEDNNLLLLEFASGTLATAIGSNCRGSSRIPWGGLGLYGTAGTLEVTAVDHASGYPLQFAVEGANAREYQWSLADQPYLSGRHLSLPEPHVYADIRDLVDAVHSDRSPRAGGEQARHVVEIIEKARAALRSGSVQKVRSNPWKGSLE